VLSTIKQKHQGQLIIIDSGILTIWFMNYERITGWNNASGTKYHGPIPNLNQNIFSEQVALKVAVTCNPRDCKLPLKSSFLHISTH
jgi:hypothetical protein